MPPVKRKRIAFSPDSFLQQELEASFIYEDTPDQIKSTAEVKADMERERPMDRLICGDVGFGKTEIAIRAAFKATCDNKQVAVLVPTTVLAFQHYQTFKERLKEFPVRIEYLSRARKASEVKAILKDLADRKNRYYHRNPQAHRERCEIQRPRTFNCRRKNKNSEWP